MDGIIEKINNKIFILNIIEIKNLFDVIFIKFNIKNKK